MCPRCFRSDSSPIHSVALSPTDRLHKSFSCNTYESPRKCWKQKTYRTAKPFRCNTYENTGGGCGGAFFHFEIRHSLLVTILKSFLFTPLQTVLRHGSLSTLFQSIGYAFFSLQRRVYPLPHYVVTSYIGEEGALAVDGDLKAEGRGRRKKLETRRQKRE